MISGRIISIGTLKVVLVQQLSDCTRYCGQITIETTIDCGRNFICTRTPETMKGKITMKNRFFTHKSRTAVARSFNTRRRAVWAAALLAALVVAAGLSLRSGLLTGAGWFPQPAQAAAANSPSGLSSADKQTRARVADSFGKLPLYFVENRGQIDKRVSYYVQGSDKTVYFTDQGLTFALNGPTEKRNETALQPASFNPQSAIRNPQ